MPRIALVVAFTAALSLAAAASALCRTRLDQMEAAPKIESGPVYLPQAKYLRPMSLGYQNALADLIWFRAISYFGAHYRSDRTYPWLGSMCDLVTDLDPRAEYVYRFGGLILPWEAGHVDAGIEILEKGVRALPDSLQLSYILGFTYFFFKADNQKALVHLRHAAALPGAHPGIARMVALLSAETLAPEDSIRFLSDLESNVDSPKVREVIHENLREMVLARNLSEIDDAIASYRARRGVAPSSVEDLVRSGDLAAVPPDPFGGHLEIDAATGKAASSTGKTPSKLHTSRVRERALQGKKGDALLAP